MCIRDRLLAKLAADGYAAVVWQLEVEHEDVRSKSGRNRDCLLYTSDAADERSSVDLGGRRILKKKNNLRDTRGSRAS